ncbi:MAG: nucleotidyltransferase [Nitrosomonadales bacterium]|nr:nucleotidyltransferase [Nitrosomonadales bacterium]
MFYLELFAALDRHKVDYLLIGGLAVSLHGVERSTMDVDITVEMNPDNLAALIDTAKELKLTPVLPVPLESLSNIELLRDWHAQRDLEAFALRTPELAGVTIDVLLFPPVDFAGMIARAVEFEIAGTAIKVVSIEDLIALKSAVGRPIDISDVEHLQRILSE